jgi:predicted phosphodiesterase
LRTATDFYFLVELIASGVFMKIYAVADIHARSHRLENIRAGIAELQPDGVVIAGDMISYFRPEPCFPR